MIRAILSSILLILLTTCSNEIPLNQDDICKMLDDNPSWKKPLLDTEKKWGAKPSTVMAIIRQESSFDSKAAPDREKILWVFPGKRPSSARGYSQAVKSTWEEYQNETGNNWARRASFKNSVDFIGWYLSKARSSGIQNYEVEKLYLAYHEGYGGYKRGTFKEKDWLLSVAKKVKLNAAKYERQLKNCEIVVKKRNWNIFD